MEKEKDGTVAKELSRKPFGIDKEEAIKIMSHINEQKLEQDHKTVEQMKRDLDREMMT